MLFTVGNLDDAINAASPFQNAFTATGVPGLDVFLTLILALLILSGNITAVTTTSRETWAFARDGGLPFHNWISKVSPPLPSISHPHCSNPIISQVSKRYNAPLNAVYLTTFWSLVLCLVNLGSAIAFNIIISLTLVSFLATYLMSIGCVLWKRIVHPQDLPPARWSLGKWGIPVNVAACLYSTLAIVFSCFPVATPTDAQDANWAPAIMAGVLGIAFVSFLLQGRKIYHGPVMFVQGKRAVEGEVQTT